MTIKIDETRIHDHDTYDLPKREEYLALVDNQATNLSQGSKDLLKKIFDDQDREEYTPYPYSIVMTDTEKGHFADLIKKEYIEVDYEYADSSFTTVEFTWVTILLNGKAMEI